MKLAIVEEKSREAQPGLVGKCRSCGATMTAKCGTLKVWHWAHRGTRVCDHWWEPETQWHRDWKNLFPESWQEFAHQAADGERHIADVKTKSGVVIEFQHSHLRREERSARECFYQNIVWVVNGLRRKRDRDQFVVCLHDGITIHQAPLIFSVFSDESALVRDWVSSRVAVYFDFGDANLWRLQPSTPGDWAHLMPVQKVEFVRAHHEGEPLDKMCSNLIAVVERSRSKRQQRHTNALAGFNQFSEQRRRARARRRF